jgi:hypothetical protein
MRVPRSIFNSLDRIGEAFQLIAEKRALKPVILIESS